MTYGIGVETDKTHENEVSYADEEFDWGFGPENAAQESVATSMLGWGIGMAIAIGVLSAVIKTSSEESTTHAHAHSN